VRTEVKAPLPEEVLTRILEAFGQELIDASDEELRQAAKDLGMDLQMKGSAAFLGLTFPAKWQLSHVFDMDALKEHFERKARKRIADAASTDPKPKARRAIRSKISTDRKDPGQK
jgi:hypothetical protein